MIKDYKIIRRKTASYIYLWCSFVGFIFYVSFMLSIFIEPNAGSILWGIIYYIVYLFFNHSVIKKYVPLSMLYLFEMLLLVAIVTIILCHFITYKIFH